MTCVVLAFAAFVGWTMRGLMKDGQVSGKEAGGDVVPEDQNSQGRQEKGGGSQREDIHPENASDISVAIKALVDDSLPEHTRLEIARRIDHTLSDSDVDYLFEALGREPETNREQWWVVMNEIIEQMRRKGVGERRMTEVLVSLASDRTKGEVTRDYAIQHLSLWIAPAKSAVGGEGDSGQVAKALESIASTVGDPSLQNTSIPGTSIMALTSATERLPGEVMAPVWDKLDPMLASMIKGETAAPVATRTTAIQAVALRKSEVHLPLVQTMARDETIDPSLRLSSIAALGVYRSEDDRAYLQQIAGGNSRMKYAAQSALKKFTN